MLEKEEIGELLAKNIARTARRHFDGRHLLFGEYLQFLTTLYLLNLSINRQLKMNLTSIIMVVSVFYLPARTIGILRDVKIFFQMFK